MAQNTLPSVKHPSHYQASFLMMAIPALSIASGAEDLSWLHFDPTTALTEQTLIARAPMLPLL